MQNYELNGDGILVQINRKPFDYANNYIDKIYPGDEHNFRYTNYLRLGYTIAALGRIPESILEVGYGKGYFLDAAEDIIPKCYGYDVTASPVPKGCIKISNEQFKSDHFDVICFWDALEHFEDIEFVKYLNCEVICISLPWCHYNSYIHNYGYDSASTWFMNWKHRKPDEHLWHFDDVSLKKFMNRMGYDSIHVPFNIEDATRKGMGSPEIPNILTGAFRKKV